MSGSVTVGQRIRQARKQAGLTQAEFASAVGISTMTIRRYESGDRIIPKDTLPRIATALGVSATYLCGTIDMVEIVRCKDCKFQVKVWHKDRRLKDGGYWLYRCGKNEDPFVCHVVDGHDDEFCSHGERRTDDGTAQV